MEIPNLDQQVRFPQQEMAARSLEEVLRCPNPPPPPQHQQQEARPRPPQPEPGQRCPRCDSTNTKFCYYNNYSLTQPRYFCKSCRRYWTKGGTLRNVPIGGGSRKNKRPAPSSSSKGALERAITPPPPPPPAFDPTPLTLSFAGLQNPPPDAFFLGNPSHGTVIPGTAVPGSTVFAAVPPRAPGFLDILRTGTPDNTTTSAFNNNQPYGFCEHWNVEEVRTGEGSGSANQVMQPFDELGGAAAAPRQQAAQRGSVDGDNGLFRGVQCQARGDGTTMTDQGRDYLSGSGSTWQGLINSFLI